MDTVVSTPTCVMEMDARMAEITFIEQGYEILGWFGEFKPVNEFSEPVNFIANVARTCYKSDAHNNNDINAEREANERLVQKLIRLDHGAMLEHSFLSVKITCDRAIANEIVRHRLFSFAQESTRYVNSTKHGFEFIMPPFEGNMEGLKESGEACVRNVCQIAASVYESMLECGYATPEIARSVLPLCTATRIVVSGNMREWRHFFKLRADSHAHPQMRALVIPLLYELQEAIPVMFSDITVDDKSKVSSDV